MRTALFSITAARALGALCALPLLSATAAERPPNIIVIITDDQGYADVGFHGCEDIPTPHMDDLAKTGVVCTNGYVSSAVCSPSRAGLMTGRYQQRARFIDNAWSPLVGLRPEMITLPQLLKEAGYSTFAVGKWHLGQLPQYRPLVRGFTDHYGFLGGGRSYLPLKDSTGVMIPKDTMQTRLWRNEEEVDDPAYLTDALGEAAAQYIREHREQPFFIYLAFNAPHVPLQATEELMERFPNLTGARQKYAAVLSAADDAIGAVTAALRETGQEEDTLVFFISDNGGHPIANAARNHPLRGEKSTLYEGGIRVPFVVKWPRRLPAGVKYDQPVISLDFMPTSLAAAGATVPEGLEFDGVDLAPYLAGEKAGAPHDTLFWRFINHRAVRQGDWKLTLPSDGEPGLYNLSQDIAESTDLSSAEPEIRERLEKALAAWEAELPPADKVPRPMKE